MIEQLVTQAILTLRTNTLSLTPSKRASDLAALERRDVDDLLTLYSPGVRDWAKRVSEVFALDEADCYSAGLEALLDCASSFEDKGPSFDEWLTLALRARGQQLHKERLERVKYEAFSLDQALSDSLDSGDTMASDLPEPPAAAELEAEAFQIPFDWSLVRQPTEGMSDHKGHSTPHQKLSSEFLSLYATLSQEEADEEDLRAQERALAPAVLWFMSPLEPRLRGAKAGITRRRAGKRVPLNFEDFLEDPTEPCGYRTVDPLTEYGVRNLLGVPTPARAAL